MKKLLIFVLVLASCSDKNKSFDSSVTAPTLSFSKDVVTIREKDYNNINSTNKGMLALYCSSPDHQLNIQFADKSNQLHFMYRGTEIQNGQPMIAMDSLLLFCSADSVGVYSVDFYLTDQLGRGVKKQLIVNCLADQPAKPAFFYSLLDNTQSQTWKYRFDASITPIADDIIVSYHYSIDGQSILTTTPVMDYSFHAVGNHDIGLFTTDDIGRNSDTVHQQILIR